MSADGTWDLTVQTTKGDLKWRLTLVPSEGGFTGSLVMTKGTAALADGRINGDELTWTAEIGGLTKIHAVGTAKVAGDSISGRLELGSLGARPFTGVRSQD